MTDETTARYCEACGQVKLPSDYWQRKITCWQDLAIANRKVADYWQRKITYWQDLAIANRKVAEEAQSQRDKLAEVFRQYRKDYCGCMIKECPDCFKECGK